VGLLGGCEVRETGCNSTLSPIHGRLLAWEEGRRDRLSRSPGGTGIRAVIGNFRKETGMERSLKRGAGETVQEGSGQ